MMHWFMTYFILIIIISSVLQFVFMQYTDVNKRKIGIAYDVFYSLLIIYCTVIIGFGLLYFTYSLYDIILYESLEEAQVSWLYTLWQSIYFSGMTMLTIGYGDIVPSGIGRLFVLIQALIGYILPTTFILKVMHLNFEEKKK